MYIRDEHPLRYRTRYYTLRGLGIGPEIVVPAGADIVLRRSSPPLEGLMSPLTDAYTTLATPTMAPLPARADLQDPPTRRFTILPVEVEMGTTALSGHTRHRYTRTDIGTGFGTHIV